MFRIKALDGLRAISIAMVLLDHMWPTLPAFVPKNAITSLFANGATGVRIFFVISGYIITRLLLMEREKTGDISIRNFYIRRIFRIFPIFYIYLAVIVILKLTIVPDIVSNYSLVVIAALYVWNYKHVFTDVPGGWYVGHLWSLAMEEQFYLFWPITFKKLSAKWLKFFLIAAIVIMPLLRAILFKSYEANPHYLIRMVHTGGDSILMGCLGALMERSGKFDLVKSWLKNNLFVFALFVINFFVITLASRFLPPFYYITAGVSIQNICIILLLLWLVNIPTKIADLLSSKWFVHIGQLSYSLYIWQQLFFNDEQKQKSFSFPLNILLVLVVAHISFYAVEKPILRLKNRFKAV